MKLDLEQTKVSLKKAVAMAAWVAAIFSAIATTIVTTSCAVFDRRQSFHTGTYSRPPTSREALNRQEKMIEGREEREQYYNAKPHMRSDRERMEYLSLPSSEARDSYMKRRGVYGDEIVHPQEMQTLVEENDIAAGMTRQAVKDAWGPPDEVEVAGNPIYGNERWRYSEQVTSSEGYMTEKRMITFESGRVVGWETR